MTLITGNQQIAKRRKSYSAHNNKSASINTSFISHFRQSPVRTKKQSGGFFPSVKRFLGKNRQQQVFSRNRTVRQNIEGNTGNKTSERKSSGFSFPIPSLATMAVVAGTVILALAALKWDDFQVRIPENLILQHISSENAAQHTLRYAAAGISGLSAFQFPTADISGTPTEIADAVEDSDLLYDLMITFQWQNYRVQRGDTVSGIAQRFGVSVGAIIASNDIRNARRLQEGAVLRIPNIDGIPYSVRAGDSLSRIAASFNVPLEVILDVNDIRSDVIRPGETIFIPGARMNDMDLRRSLGDMFIFPVPSRHVTSPFGMRRDPFTGVLAFHTGIDLRAPIGTPVVAAMDGVVSVVGENRTYGRYIIITHPNGYKTFYAHLNSVSVRRGDRVQQGRRIGESGNTGRSTGPHLHFSVFDHNNRLVNPLDLLR